MHDDRWERMTLTEIREEFEDLAGAAWNALRDFMDLPDWLTSDDNWHPTVRAHNETMDCWIAFEANCAARAGTHDDACPRRGHD
jgi:hypothetical protein